MSETLHFGWFLPTMGDSNSLGDPTATIEPSMKTFERIALAAEEASFEYLLVPVQTQCWDAFMSCAMIAARTKRIKPLLAARCGFIAPTVLAKMISTLDQLTEGRVSVNLIAGGSLTELAADGSFYDHDDRYRVMDETVTLMRRAWTEVEPFDFEGEFFKAEGVQVLPRPFQQPHPSFYLGGSSSAAMEVSSKHASCHLFWGDTPEKIAPQLERVREKTRNAGRESELKFGMRLQVIVRESEDEAWAAAADLIKDASSEQKIEIKNMWSDSEANNRMKELGKADDFLLAPHLWSGITSVRPGAGVAIVGTPEQVISTIEDFVAIGCTDFCLSGYLHDVEATRVGELVLPHFNSRREPASIEGLRVAML